ncbi:MAG TPA: tetratricopeptide repeat protein, partial [Candidatus Eisenbacteria bacterium]
MTNRRATRVIVFLLMSFVLPVMAGSPDLLLPGAALAEPSYPMDTDPIRLGRKAADQGNWDEAHRRFDEAMTAGYHVDEAEEGLARVAVVEGRLADAEALYRRAIEDHAKKDGEFPEARAGLGLLLLRLDRVPEAAAEFDLALAADDDCWPAQYGRGRVLLLTNGDPAEARRLIENGAKKKTPAAHEAMYHHGMGLVHLSADRLADAEAEALIAAGLDAGNPEYARLVAEIYEKKNIPSLAATTYERLLTLPGAAPLAPVHRALGRSYERMQRWNDARDQYVKAVQADSTLAPAWLDLGNLLHRA